MSRVIGIIMSPMTVNVYDFGKNSCTATSAPDQDNVENIQSSKWDIYPPMLHPYTSSPTTVGRVLDYVGEQVSPISIEALRDKIPVEELRWLEIKEDVSNSSLTDQRVSAADMIRDIDNMVQNKLRKIRQTCISCGMPGTALNYQFIILVNPVTLRFALARACWMCQWKCIKAMWHKLSHRTLGS
jgi:hypothetical protein